MMHVVCESIQEILREVLLTPTAGILSNIQIVVDKMHMSGHTDKWCWENCDPQLFPQLEKVYAYIFCICVDNHVLQIQYDWFGS